jgi:SulP family sulfate permease
MDKIKHYLISALRQDFLAGLTVSMIAIPQSMAYATIAGVEPVMGLYAAMLPALIAALFGSSKYLVTGATNAISLTTASVVIAD